MPCQLYCAWPLIQRNSTINSNSPTRHIMRNLFCYPVESTALNHIAQWICDTWRIESINEMVTVRQVKQTQPAYIILPCVTLVSHHVMFVGIIMVSNLKSICVIKPPIKPIKIWISDQLGFSRRSYPRGAALAYVVHGPFPVRDHLEAPIGDWEVTEASALNRTYSWWFPRTIPAEKGSWKLLSNGVWVPILRSSGLNHYCGMSIIV